MGDDTSASEDERVRGAVVTSVEHHEPMVTSISGECDVETHGDGLESSKHAMSKDNTLEREAKRVWLP